MGVRKAHLLYNRLQTYIETLKKNNELTGEFFLKSMDLISSDTAMSICHAASLNKRFPEGEVAITRDASSCFKYANLIRDRFPLGEPVMLKSRRYCKMLDYATDNRKERWPELEDLISQLKPSDITNLGITIELIFYLSKFGEAECKPLEEVVVRDPRSAYMYALQVRRGRFPEGESMIASSPEYITAYAQKVLKGRFLLGEKSLEFSPQDAYTYIRALNLKNVESLEDIILTDGDLCFHYAAYVLKGRFIRGETVIMKNKTVCENYLRFLDEIKDN